MYENVQELTSREQWIEAFPVINQLRTDLIEESYLELLQEMRKDGYMLFALYNKERMVSVAGLS